MDEWCSSFTAERRFLAQIHTPSGLKVTTNTTPLVKQKGQTLLMGDESDNMQIDRSNNSVDQLQSLKPLVSLRNIRTWDSRKSEETQKVK